MILRGTMHEPPTGAPPLVRHCSRFACPQRRNRYRRALGRLASDGDPRPQFWTLEPSKGRVFVSIPGHYFWTFDDPLFRILLLRGLAWTAKEPVNRFNDLAAIGARLAQ
jgi:type 1 glutamine amidotransferase